MAVHTGGNSCDRVWRDYNVLSDGLAAPSQMAAEDERDWITAVARSRKSRRKQRIRSYTIWQGLVQRDVILLTCCYFFATTGGYGIAFWLPTILKRLSGQSDVRVTLFAALPYLAGFLAAAGQRMALGPKARAPAGNARRAAFFLSGISAFAARGGFRIHKHDRGGDFVYARRRLLFFLSSVFLGGSNGLPHGVGGRGIHRTHQFVGKPWWVCGSFNDGIPGPPNPFFSCRTALPGRESVPFGNPDASHWSRTSSRFGDWSSNESHVFRDRGSSFQEVEVTTFVSLRNVLHK